MLLLALCACHGDLAKHEAANADRFAIVHRGELVDRVLLTGDLRAASSIDLAVPRTESWQLAIRWMAEDGTLVKAGDKVLEFDNSAVTAQLEQKHLALLAAEMTFRTARDLGVMETASKTTELHQHQIELDKATVKADVPADLLAGREAQERQLEKKRAQVAVKKAQQELDAQRAESTLELHIKQIDLDKARRVIEAAEKTIADLVLTSPRDGMIVVEDHPWLGRKFHLGDTVQPGMKIISLPDLGQPMEVHSELSDVDDGRVSVGMAGTCTLDAYPADPIACTVTDLTPVARTKGETSLRRAFAVVLALQKPDARDAARMRPGMSVKVELHRQPLQAAVAVPRGAVVIEGKTARVRMATGELRTVTLGSCDAQMCAVDQGIADGDGVMIGGGS